MSTEKTPLENENQPSCLGAVIRWVASTDRIPENRQKVLCYTGHRMIENSWCMHTDQDAEWFKRTFTHWTEDVLPPRSDGSPEGFRLNVSGICEVGDFGDEIFNRSNKTPILHIPCYSQCFY